jgi:hypothetical protein
MVLRIWAADESRIPSREEIKDKFVTSIDEESPYSKIPLHWKLQTSWGEVLCSHDKVYLVKEWVGVFEGDSLLPFVVFQSFNSFSLGYNEGVHGLDTPNIVEGFQLSDKQESSLTICHCSSSRDQP